MPNSRMGQPPEPKSNQERTVGECADDPEHEQDRQKKRPPGGTRGGMGRPAAD
jgi:hypothetical protein